MIASDPVALRVTGAGKSFPPATIALAEVDFELRRGEVHALLGENGAGKSTLSRIIAGLLPPDTGNMFLNGQPFAPKNRREAERSGVRMVMQELNLIPTLTVAESIFLDRLPSCWGWIRRDRLNEQAHELLARVGLGDIDPEALVGSLGIGKQQLVEIAAGLSAKCGILILDEPTASLTGTEAELLFAQIETLQSEGVAILYISHRMEEISRIANRVTVLRDGKTAGARAAGQFNLDEIIQLMVGRELAMTARRETTVTHQPALRVEHLCAGKRVRDVSFTVNRGEILGFAGLMGSGRTESMRAVFGVDPKHHGTLYFGEATRPCPIESPRDAVRAGMAFVTEDRKNEGLLLPWSIQENISITRIKNVLGRWGWIRRDLEQEQADQQVASLAIRCSSSRQPVRELSGGNQQKVVIAKWSNCDSDILIFDEPTRGIDIGAKFEIYELINRLAREGKAILLVSSELPELLLLSHRIAVMSGGHLVRVFNADAFDQSAIMQAALSHHLNKDTSETAVPA